MRRPGSREGADPGRPPSPPRPAASRAPTPPRARRPGPGPAPPSGRPGDPAAGPAGGPPGGAAPGVGVVGCGGAARAHRVGAGVARTLTRLAAPCPFGAHLSMTGPQPPSQDQSTRGQLGWRLGNVGVLLTQVFVLTHFLFFPLSRKITFLLWRVNIYSIDFPDLVTWPKMPV